MTDCSNPLLTALDLRLTTMIEAVESKAILRDNVTLERIAALKESIERIDLAEIRRLVFAEAQSVAQREAVEAVERKVSEMRVATGRIGGWQTGNEAIVRIAIQGVMLILAATLGAVISHLVR